MRWLCAISATRLGLATMTSCPSVVNIRLSHGERGPTSITTRAPDTLASSRVSAAVVVRTRSSRGISPSSPRTQTWL